MANVLKTLSTKYKKQKTTPKKCNGMVFRGRLNAFVNSKWEYVYQERMLPLKRKSCPGCEQCGYLDEYLHEFTSMGTLPIIENIEHGAIYSLQVVNQSREWETGIVDDWDIEFIKCVK